MGSRKSTLATEEFRRLRKCRQLFSRYDEGVRISPKMMYSVTREEIANCIAIDAAEAGFANVVDGCGGAGGNSIAFALAGLNVACVELDADTLADAEHNAEIYGVAEYIKFIQGDILEFECPFEPQSTLFHISPEWGGPSYQEQDVFDPELMNPPLGAILEYARAQKYGAISVYAPRTIDLIAVEKMGCKECRYMFHSGHCNAVCLSF